jgi:hypothetical protein
VAVDVAGRRFSQAPLPLPAVLVIGTEGSPFSHEVWNGIAGRRGVQPGESIAWDKLQPVLDKPRADAIAELGAEGLGHQSRALGRRPIPIQYSHGQSPTATELGEGLLRVLDLFDVWGIIASGSAGDVSPLRAALSGIDVPLLVTTDSTTVAASSQRPNELRLMPSNQAQATAMLFAATRALTPSPTDVDKVLRYPTPIAYSFEDTPQVREYVKDLRTQLEAEANRLDIAISHLDRTRDHLGPVIGIGYQEHAFKLIRNRPQGRGRVTILSDGCATPEVREEVEKRRKEDIDHWFVTRPAVALDAIGNKAFEAISEAGHAVVTTDRSSVHETVFRTSVRDSIRTILSDSDGISFNFDGIENVAAAYRVLPISQEDDLPGADRSPTQDDDRGPAESGAAVIPLAERRRAG